MRWSDMPPPAALRAFAALAESRSLTAAGAALNVSHAAVSQHVRGLEERLGVKLIRREGRGVALTAAGTQLAETLLAAFGAIGRTLDEMTAAADARPLQVTTTPNFTANWLAPRLADFRRRHPGVELMINPSPQVADLGPDGYDIAIRSGTGDWRGLVAERLLPTSFVILAAPSLIGDRRITGPADLLDLPWIQELGTDEVTQWLRANGVTEQRAGNILHMPGNYTLDAIRRGEGIGAMARAFAEPDIAAGRVVALFEDAVSTTGYYLVTAPGVQRPAARAFAAWLRRQAAGQEVAPR